MFLIVARYLLPKGYRGMTVFPFIILQRKEDVNDVVIINHEKIHIRQQLELLIVPFFIWYFVEYGVRRVICGNHNQAYQSISFEKEAYANEKDLSYLKKRPFWNFRKFY